MAPVASGPAASDDASEFPCSIIIRTPFPTARLAQIALTALAVDEELSPLVRRSFSLAAPPIPDIKVSSRTGGALHDPSRVQQEASLLVTHYRATTHRMLRVSTNGFFESLGVVLSCMRELDVDCVVEDWIGDGEEVLGGSAKDNDIRGLNRVQGLTETGRLDAAAAQENQH